MKTTPSKHPLTIISTIIFLVLVVWAGYLFLQPIKDSLANYLFNNGYSLLYFLGAAIALYRATRLGLRTSIGTTLLFFGLGLASFGLALWIWSYFNLFAHIETPFPSLADLFFLGQYPLFAIGFFFLLRTFGATITRRLVAESVLFFSVSFIALFLYNTRFLPFPQELFPQVISFGYIVADTLLISIILVAVRAEGGIISKGTQFFILAFLSTTIADLLFQAQTANSTYYNGNLVDVLYTVAGYLFCLGLITITGYSSPSLPDSFQKEPVHPPERLSSPS